MIHHGTDWNRHRGVGATLLENWVEERAVGDLIVEERSDLPHLSRAGHKNLIVDSKEQASFTTNHRDDFKFTPRLAKRMVGKRRQLLEEEIMKQTLEEIKEPLPDRSTHGWVSTTYSDFSHSDVYKPARGLGQESPSKEMSEKYSRPITFWTDFAVKGSGTAICSTNAVELQKRGGLSERDSNGAPILGLRACQVYQDHASSAAVRFGRHATFSTPIKESLKDLHQEPN